MKRGAVCGLLSVVLALSNAVEAAAQDTTAKVQRATTGLTSRARVLSPKSEQVMAVRHVDVVVPPERVDTAGFGRSATAAMIDLITVRGDSQAPAPIRPSVAQVARTLYATKARVETAVAISPTLGLVWLAEDSAAKRTTELPFRIFGLNSRTNRMMSLIPVIDSMGGLRYHSSERQYAGTMLIGFRDSLQPNGVVRLDHPLRISLGGTLERISPETLVFEQINEVKTRVFLASGRRPENAVLRLHPDFSSKTVDVPVQVQIDSLLVTTPATMRGLGTEATEIFVALRPGTLAPDDSLEVVISARRGSLSPSRVIFVRPGVSGRAVLRSAGIGTEALTVESGVMAASAITIQYTIPWLLLVIAIAGAVGGTLLRWWKGRATQPPPRIAWSRAAASVLIIAGLSVGLEKLGLGYAVGLSEIGTFVMAAIFAGGPAMLAWNKDT